MRMLNLNEFQYLFQDAPLLVLFADSPSIGSPSRFLDAGAEADGAFRRAQPPNALIFFVTLVAATASTLSCSALIRFDRPVDGGVVGVVRRNCCLIGVTAAFGCGTSISVTASSSASSAASRARFCSSLGNSRRGLMVDRVKRLLAEAPALRRTSRSLRLSSSSSFDSAALSKRRRTFFPRLDIVSVGLYYARRPRAPRWSIFQNHQTNS